MTDLNEGSENMGWQLFSHELWRHHTARVRNCTAVDLKSPPPLCPPALKIIFNHPILEKVVIITNFGQDNWNEEELCFASLALAKLFFLFFLLLLNAKLNPIISFTYWVLSYPLAPTTMTKQEWVRLKKFLFCICYHLRIKLEYTIWTADPHNLCRRLKMSCSCWCGVGGH